MTFPAEVLELLSWDEAIGARCNGLPIDEQRSVIHEALEQRADQTGLVIESVAQVRDFSVRVEGGSIRLRIYRPFGDVPHPAFLHIHGGGFVHGSIDWVYNAAKCTHICLNAGCVVATVDYRLAPEFPFPTAAEDCYSALRWLVEHAEELAIDPTRLAVGGESAGGNLAAVLALMTRDRGGPSISLQLLEVPVTDMSDRNLDYPSLDLFGAGYGLDRSNIEAFTNDYLPNRDDRANPYASPLRAPDLSALAPAHVLTAEFDPLRDAGEAYAQRLRDAGVKTTQRRFNGQTHGTSSLWQSWPPARAWMDEVVTAIRDGVSAGVSVGSSASPSKL
jgi:acetyl esterase